MISISSGIVDSDPKGENGGTKYWLEINVQGTKKRYEYTIFDVIEGRFDKEAILKPFIELKKKLEKEQDEKERAEKKAALEQRQAAVSSNPELDTIVDSIISNNTKVVGEYQSGKDKALNSLVGMVIKEVKAKNLSVPDGAFAITTLLKNKLGRQNG